MLKLISNRNNKNVNVFVLKQNINLILASVSAEYRLVLTNIKQKQTTWNVNNKNQTYEQRCTTDLERVKTREQQQSEDSRTEAV